eukprot:365872-Chlamydomonas_euryale.AAC.3
MEVCNDDARHEVVKASRPGQHPKVGEPGSSHTGTTKQSDDRTAVAAGQHRKAKCLCPLNCARSNRSCAWRVPLPALHTECPCAWHVSLPALHTECSCAWRPHTVSTLPAATLTSHVRDPTGHVRRACQS